jgi:hypothetical protein
MSSPVTSAHLARIGAVAALVGAPLLLVSTLLHPLAADPNDASAAFAEYATSHNWVWIQAVDGVALKVTVDRWASASAEGRGPAFEAAFAVRQVEIGLGSFLSMLSGVTLAIFGKALLATRQYPAWFGWTGLLDGVGMLAAGTAQASMGFAEPAMSISMLASSALVLWFVAAGVLMWRLSYVY